VHRAPISPYSLRVVACIVVWLIAVAEQLRSREPSGLENQ
jgi:hypothetical protein